MMKKILLITLICIFFLTGCKSKTYTVTFMDDDKVLSSQKVTEGSNINKSYKPEKEGYIFVYWVKDGLEYNSSNKVNEDMTLIATWTPKPDMKVFHTVTFTYGDTVKTQSVADQDTAKKPERDPKMDKHTFIGWYVGDTLYDFSQPVTKDIVIQAKFQKNRIIITYNLNGGTGLAQVEIDKGTIPTRPKDPSKLGYNFINWTLDGKPYNFDFPLDEDVTINANYEATVYVKVTFDTDGGNAINSEMIPAGSTLSKLPQATKDGYIFKYWQYLDSEFDINTKITKDIVLVAQYEEIDTE